MAPSCADGCGGDGSLRGPLALAVRHLGSEVELERAAAEPSKPSVALPSPGLVDAIVDAVSPATVEGVVTLEGAPVEGVEVELAGQKVRTSSKGEFVFKDVPRETTLVVTAIREERVARAQVYLNGSTQFPQPLTLELMVAHRVKGRVLGPRGEPVAAATVECADWSLRPGFFALTRGMTVISASGNVDMGPLEVFASTAGDGTYELQLKPGGWRCAAIAPGFGGSAGVELQVTGAAEVDHHLREELTLTGDVSTTDGALVTEGSVSVRRTLSARLWLTAPRSRLDAQGRFSVSGLAAGEYDFEVSTRTRLVVLHHTVPPTAVHWTLPDETILEVNVSGASAGDMVMVQRPESPGSWSGTGIQNGKAEFKQLAPGPYRLRLKQNTVDQADQVTAEVIVVEGKKTVVALEARATLQVSGVVLGPDGAGVATEVELRKSGSRSPLHFVPPTYTDAEGRFTLALAKGTTGKLHVTAPPGFLQPAPLDVKSTDDKLIIRLSKSPMVRGQVVDAQGRPLERFTVDGVEQRAGRFEVPFAVQATSTSDGVSRAWMTLSIRADGFVTLQREVDQPERDVDVGRLTLEQARDVVVVVRTKGKPLSGAQVLVAGTRLSTFGRDRDVTNADGRYTLASQPMGELKLVVSHPDAVTTPVTVRARETTVEVTMLEGLSCSGTVSGRERVVVAERGDVVEVVAVEKGAFAFHNLTPGVWRLGAIDMPMDFARSDRERLMRMVPKDRTVEVTVSANVTGVLVP